MSPARYVKLNVEIVECTVVPYDGVVNKFGVGGTWPLCGERVSLDDGFSPVGAHAN